MRALRCESLTGLDGVALRAVPDPEPQPGQVLVRVHAAALNFPDLLFISGAYQVAIPVPFTVGSEFAGQVLAVGEGVDETWIGRPVMAGGMTGAFAERNTVPVGDIHPIPEGLDYTEAAAFHVAYETAYHSLFTIGQAQKGDWVVVLGAGGGVGLATVDIAVRSGLHVAAVASRADRLSAARQLGAEIAIDASTEDVKERIKQLPGGGADLVVDPAGGANAEAALRGTKWGGRFVVVGFASGEIPRIPLNLILLKGVILRGFELRTINDHIPDAGRQALAGLGTLIADGMKPHIGAVYPLERAVDALRDLQDRKVNGKAVITMNAGI